MISHNQALGGRVLCNLSNMHSMNCFITVFKILLRLTKRIIFVPGWCGCSTQNWASVQSICNWHSTKYCGALSKDSRGDKLPAVLVFTLSRIPNDPRASWLEPYFMSFAKSENPHVCFLLCFQTILLHHLQIDYPWKCFLCVSRLVLQTHI